MALSVVSLQRRDMSGLGDSRLVMLALSLVAHDPKQTYVPCGLEPLGSAIWGQSLASRPRGADEVLYNRDKRYRFICNAIPRL
jgi:hypothetical protein